MNLPISMNKEAIQSGTYTVHVKASAEDKKYTWELTKDFTIQAEKAKKLNAEAVEVKKDNSLWIYLGIGLLILLLIIIISLIIKLRQSKKDNAHSEQ
ncbi:hypothetical protein IGI37_003058 [Enterococcus sp. AZ194]|uniref:WxL protein host-binding domain-containing protein n=1 Tax=Enterococcus sp. AZ194 TaxID=2774629 RepID=UPI003F26E841